jgi:SprT protein
VNPKDEHFFNKYFPQGSILYCFELWKKYNIQFTVTKPRKSVYGNYRYFHGIHQITVNGDLKPEAFLVTFLHEVAHLEVREKFGHGRKPHGAEWQNCFRNLLRPMIDQEIFAPDIALALWNHIQNPKATSCTDPELHKLLTHNDSGYFEDEIHVEDLPMGSHFVYDGREFLLRQKIRTRFDCLEIKTKKAYRFLGAARVRKIEAKPTEEIRLGNPVQRPIHQIKPREIFMLQGRKFSLKEKRRTRFLVEELGSKKEYLIDQNAIVEVVPA